MGSAGPAPRLPPVDAVVRQSSIREPMMLPLQGREVVEPDFGLVPDLLAAATLLSSPSIPAPPPLDNDFDFGGITLHEISELLPAESALPLELNTPCGQDVTIVTSETRLITYSSADALLASPGSVPPSPPLPEALLPVAPVSSRALSSANPIPNPVASPRVVPPVTPASNSGDGDAWDSDDDTDPYAASNLIRASLTISGRPPLPPPPERHPSAGWSNHFDPAADVDVDAEYPIRKLIDRWSEPPHVAFLVEWACRPCQLSWEWPDNL
ncbi:unnamed protein product [Phytophthora fragariaefolia]|uniref:Unnamed protein product n=1 Tax=Phytophthora fragariaefolia TaxID=1490495 RepID=A0A9W6Y516_9STRA|nr:unnamed protein product [Phytophthora fragariaefolia]